ncbi:hypothetical protein BAY61_18390 [Prauserella marina]|nr:hypothetical protein BAY61_18390 [Prauserella marina]
MPNAQSADGGQDRSRLFGRTTAVLVPHSREHAIRDRHPEFPLSQLRQWFAEVAFPRAHVVLFGPNCLIGPLQLSEVDSRSYFDFGVRRDFAFPNNTDTITQRLQQIILRLGIRGTDTLYTACDTVVVAILRDGAMHTRRQFAYPDLAPGAQRQGRSAHQAVPGAAQTSVVTGVDWFQAAAAVV